MSEVHFVALIVAGLCAMMLLQAMPPDWFVTILLAAFNLLNLLMLFGNGWQAWKKDPRFMNPIRLALIAGLVGVVLFAFFGIMAGIRPFTLWVSLPYLGTAAVTLVLSLVSPHKWTPSNLSDEDRSTS